MGKLDGFNRKAQRVRGVPISNQIIIGRSHHPDPGDLKGSAWSGILPIGLGRVSRGVSMSFQDRGKNFSNQDLDGYWYVGPWRSGRVASAAPFRSYSG